MLIGADWNEAMEWAIANTDRYVRVMLTTDGGLAIDGPSYFAGVKQKDGTFGIELSGLTFTFMEDEVGGVVIDQDTDSLFFDLRDRASFLLRPMTADEL